jgi:uncharacterized membrane protein YozB (DUF420 family)
MSALPVSQPSVSAASPESPATLRALFGVALATSAWAWWTFAWPVITGASRVRHVDHFALTYAHMIGGTIMLVAGSAALFIGWTRRGFRHHKWIGATYLIGGGLGAALGLGLSLRNSHRITGITVATGTLAAVWLVAAAMAFRAVRNRRFEAHREWMVRSYVLTWTFVGCRIAGRVPSLDTLGDAGGAAVVWLSWVLPLVACEVALQWRATSRR